MIFYVRVLVNQGYHDERMDYRLATYQEQLDAAREMYHCGVLPCEKCGHLGTWDHLKNPKGKP